MGLMLLQTTGNGCFALVVVSPSGCLPSSNASRNSGSEIARYGIGVDNIDLAAARVRGIKVANVREYGADVEVADHTLALFLTPRRRIVSRDRTVREGAWQIGQLEPISRISGSTYGMIGFGRIGRAVERRFADFGVKDAMAGDPELPEEKAMTAGVEVLTFGKLAERCVIIALHGSAKAEKRHLIGSSFLSQVKKGAILVDAAIASLIDEEALAIALERGGARSRWPRCIRNRATPQKHVASPSKHRGK